MTPREVALCIAAYRQRMIDLFNVIAQVPHAINRVMGGKNPLSDFQIQEDE